MGIKIALGLVWVWAFLSLFLAIPLAGFGALVFWGMLAIHFVEFLFLRSTFARAGGSMRHHFVQVMLFGAFHLMAVRAQQGDTA